jgi:hypothetical protein
VTAGPQSEQLLTVHLLELPVPLAARAQQWFEELLREFALIHADNADNHDRPEVPGRLMAMVDLLVTRYSPFSDDARDRLEAAIDLGEQVIEDHVTRLPPEAAAAAQALAAMMDEADRFCRQGKHLLTLAEPESVLAYRRWYLREIVTQLGGGAPTPWSDRTGEPVLAAPGPRDDALALQDITAVQAAARVADLAVAGRYVPTAEGPEPVAGDFFEVLPLGPDRVALIVGDVAGHGTAALSAMRRLRSAALAGAPDADGPADLLGRLDRALQRCGEEEFATLWYGEYRPSTGTLTYAAAGHPPPALHVDGCVRVLAEASAPALGTGVVQALAVEHRQVLPPGAVLVAYSDGLLERRGTDFDIQLAGLTALVERACDPARPSTDP